MTNQGIIPILTRMLTTSKSEGRPSPILPWRSILTLCLCPQLLIHTVVTIHVILSLESTSSLSTSTGVLEYVCGMLKSCALQDECVDLIVKADGMKSCMYLLSKSVKYTVPQNYLIQAIHSIVYGRSIYKVQYNLRAWALWHMQFVFPAPPCTAIHQPSHWHHPVLVSRDVKKKAAHPKQGAVHSTGLSRP